MGGIGPTQVLIVFAVVLLLFGAKRLPDAARAVGRSARILRSELGERDDRQTTAEEPPSAGSDRRPDAGR